MPQLILPFKLAINSRFCAFSSRSKLGYFSFQFVAVVFFIVNAVFFGVSKVNLRSFGFVCRSVTLNVEVRKEAKQKSGIEEIAQ